MDQLGNNQEDAANHAPCYSQGQIELRPFIPGNAGNAEAGPLGAVGRPEHIGNAVTKLVGQDGGLAGNAADIGQRGQNREQHDGFPAAGADEEVQDRDNSKDTQDDNLGGEFRQQLGAAINNRIYNLPFTEDDGDGTA